jgi:hypothetical protein
VNVEGWHYAGSRLGIFPVLKEVQDVSIEGEIKYRAQVELLNLRTSQVCGAGLAICSNKEQGKKYYQEFAIASMAQTRAVGKAYRNMLAWIIRAAGYEPTPAEEMEYGGNVQLPRSSPSPAPAEKTKDEPEVALGPIIRYATAKQKEEIIRLLNHPVITRQEKTKMLLNINKIDLVRADECIVKLKKAIQERQEETVKI